MSRHRDNVSRQVDNVSRQGDNAVTRILFGTGLLLETLNYWEQFILIKIV